MKSRRIRDEGITDAELSFSKEHIKGNLFISLESSETRMGRLAKNEIYFGGYIPLKETLREIDSIQERGRGSHCAGDIRTSRRDIHNSAWKRRREKVENVWKR